MINCSKHVHILYGQKDVLLDKGETQYRWTAFLGAFQYDRKHRIIPEANGKNERLSPVIYCSLLAFKIFLFIVLGIFAN